MMLYRHIFTLTEPSNVSSIITTTSYTHIILFLIFWGKNTLIFQKTNTWLDFGKQLDKCTLRSGHLSLSLALCGQTEVQAEDYKGGQGDGHQMNKWADASLEL